MNEDIEETCRVIRPDTCGYQMCWLQKGHEGNHQSQDLQEWPWLSGDYLRGAWWAASSEEPFR